MTPPTGGRTLEEGIKKRLGAFRTDFPVTAGQQVSLIQYAPDAGTVCIAGWEPTTPPNGGGPWRRDSRSGWGAFRPDFPVAASQVSIIACAPDAGMVCNGWVGANYSTFLGWTWRRESRGSWVLLDLTPPWPDRLVYYGPLDAGLVCIQLGGSQLLRLLGADPGGGN
jgi:hypothetical protein